ncbi:hypothetical protein H4S03_001444, partial [Coemansia sp. S3946]
MFELGTLPDHLIRKIAYRGKFNPMKHKSSNKKIEHLNGTFANTIEFAIDNHSQKYVKTVNMYANYADV